VGHHVVRGEGASPGRREATQGDRGRALMVEAAQNLSVNRQQKRQRQERNVWTAVVVLCALAVAISLVLLTGPLPLALGLTALILVVAIFLRPRFGLYLLLFCSLFLEQWGIAGLDPVTARLPFYQTFSGTGGIPLPVSPLEVLLLVTFVAVALPQVARRGVVFVRGPLFTPLLLFLGFVVLSIAYGAVRGAGVGPFDVRAAWEETRSFFYLAIMYVLVCNLLKTREQLRTFIWLFIAAIGLKSIQGIVRYIDVTTNGLQVDSITGHEDVVFFSAFVLLITGLLLFGAKRDAATWRQMRIMLLVLLPLLFTLLVTNRRLGFIVLGVGLGLVAVLLFRTRRDLFLRLAPVVLVTLGIYVGLFWNGTGALSEPIRAVRSLVAPATERDRSSNAWRDLENTNIDYNLRAAPITGLGFGRPYSFIVAQPPIDATGFTYWRYIAHNAIYWVWMKMGLVGFILFWNLIGSAVILGIVTFRQVRDKYLKALALTVAGVVVMQVIFSYGDLGLTYSRSMVFLGCMLGVLACLPALENLGEAEEKAARSPGQEPTALPASARVGAKSA
ncbi:MAG: O-antigen ligase family protein, partial [Chloroflexota bacterium]